jgi:hypothetical protein
MGGVPCLRGLRIPVATIVGLVAEGQTTMEILDLYPDLEAETFAKRCSSPLRLFENAPSLKRSSSGCNYQWSDCGDECCDDWMQRLSRD